MKRYEWLVRQIHLHHLSIGAEVGTGRGDTAEALLRDCPRLHMVEVAFYPSDKGKGLQNNQTGGGAKRQFLKRIFPYMDRITLIWDPSAQAVQRVPDNLLDFVFIDGDHEYDSVLQDIRLWHGKLRPGGLLCGHDYNTRDARFKGVVSAVHTYFGDRFDLYPSDDVWYYWKKQ